MSRTAEVRRPEADRLATLLRQRYRAEPAVTEAPWNEAIDAILDHRSARAYLPDALPAGTLEVLIAAYRSARDGVRVGLPLVF